MRDEIRRQPQVIREPESQGSTIEACAHYLSSQSSEICEEEVTATVRTPTPPNQFTLVLRTPERNTKRSLSPESPLVQLPLPSTAPPKLGRTANGQEEDKTKKYQKTVADGDLEGSQYTHRDEVEQQHQDIFSICELQI